MLYWLFSRLGARGVSQCRRRGLGSATKTRARRLARPARRRSQKAPGASAGRSSPIARVGLAHPQPSLTSATSADRKSAKLEARASSPLARHQPTIASSRRPRAPRAPPAGLATLAGGRARAHARPLRASPGQARCELPRARQPSGQSCLLNRREGKLGDLTRAPLCLERVTMVSSRDLAVVVRGRKGRNIMLQRCV